MVLAERVCRHNAEIQSKNVNNGEIPRKLIRFEHTEMGL
jgi:hypothetical protein